MTTKKQPRVILAQLIKKCNKKSNNKRKIIKIGKNSGFFGKSYKRCNSFSIEKSTDNTQTESRIISKIGQG